MKKFKKNLSKTIFASFFVFQFVVSTSVMPLIVNAEDVVLESDVQSSEETTSEATKEESASSEESTDASQESPEMDSSTTEEKPSEEVKEEESKPTSDISKEPTKPTKPEDDKKYGTLTVCKMIAIGFEGTAGDADYEFLSGFNFTVGFLEGSAHLGEAFKEGEIPNPIKFTTPLDINNAIGKTPVECRTISDLPLGNYYYAEEIITPDSNDAGVEWNEPQYNDFYSGDLADMELAAYYPYSNQLFTENIADDDIRNTDADGHVTLTEDRPNRTVLVVNSFKLNEDPDNGVQESISVCKIIAKDVDGTLRVASPSEIPNGYTFTLPWAEPTDKPGTEIFNDQPVIGTDATFSTDTFVPNRKILSSSNGYDAMCQTFSDLSLGSYFYGEEVITGANPAVWTNKLYSDQATRRVDDLGDLFPYDDTLFTEGYSAHNADLNTNVDGHIVLIPSRKVRTIVLVNVFNGDDDNTRNTPPKLSINPNVRCLQTDAQTYNYLGGVTASDLEDGNLTSSITYTTNPAPVVLGQEGVYLITYTVTDNGGLSDTGTRTLYIKENCGGGDDEDKIPPVITFNPHACIAINTSFDFMSGVVVTDNQDSVGQIIVKNNGILVVNFGVAGTYTVTYTATDSDGNETVATRTITLSVNCDNGGGDKHPTITLPENQCYEVGTTNFNFLTGVIARDSEGNLFTLDLVANVLGEENIDFTQVGQDSDLVTYKFTDPYTGEIAEVTRSFFISADCDNGGGGGGGGGGGSSSSGGSRGNRGEVLGAATCVAFTTYNRLGNRGGEIKALQTFLNEYMDAGLTVDGVYGRTTAQAVHDFQAFHWSEVIDPWTPPLSPNTTGWQYKTTRATINAIIDCPEPAVYLEDPGVMYEVTEVKDMKPFTTEQMEMIYNLLAEAQSGQVLGATDSNVVTPDIFDPNYDLMFGK